MSDIVIPVERIERAIYLIRGQKVMLDRDLAMLYGVETKALKQAVRRNAYRFPDDFAFVLAREEFATLRSQFVTSKSESRGGTQYLPMAFTEQGVAMLSSVLNSKRAIVVNIAIMRTFVKLRQMLDSHAKLAKKLAELEAKYDEQFRVVFEVLNELIAAPEPKRKPIGFCVRERRVTRFGNRNLHTCFSVIFWSAVTNPHARVRHRFLVPCAKAASRGIPLAARTPRQSSDPNNAYLSRCYLGPKRDAGTVRTRPRPFSVTFTA